MIPYICSRTAIGIFIGRDRAAWQPMTREDVLRLRDIDSEIDGHPNPAEGFPFFPTATGSLGQRLSIAAADTLRNCRCGSVVKKGRAYDA